MTESDFLRRASRQDQFLAIASRDDAEAQFRAHLSLAPLGAESVDLALARTRILASDVIASVDVPGFDRASVDGFAVSCADIEGASPQAPLRLTLNREVLTPGITPSITLRKGTATPIATGGMLPRGADAVVMVEHTEPVEEGVELGILVRRAMVPGGFVAGTGSDMQINEDPAGRGAVVALSTAMALAASVVLASAVVSSAAPQVSDRVLPPVDGLLRCALPLLAGALNTAATSVPDASMARGATTIALFATTGALSAVATALVSAASDISTEAPPCPTALAGPQEGDEAMAHAAPLVELASTTMTLVSTVRGLASRAPSPAPQMQEEASLREAASLLAACSAAVSAPLEGPEIPLPRGPSAGLASIAAALAAASAQLASIVTGASAVPLPESVPPEDATMQFAACTAAEVASTTAALATGLLNPLAPAPSEEAAAASQGAAPLGVGVPVVGEAAAPMHEDCVEPVPLHALVKTAAEVADILLQLPGAPRAPPALSVLAGALAHLSLLLPRSSTPAAKRRHVHPGARFGVQCRDPGASARGMRERSPAAGGGD